VSVIGARQRLEATPATRRLLPRQPDHHRPISLGLGTAGRWRVARPVRPRVRGACRLYCVRLGLGPSVGGRGDTDLVSSHLPTAVVIVDVDGVVSAVHPEAPVWGDEAEVGRVFGPVLVSATLCARLNALHALPGVECWWLTSWSSEMRAAMRAFPGRDWGVIAEPPTQPGSRGWWKLKAIAEWLSGRPDVKSIAWCDDHLRGGSPPAVRRVLAVHDVKDVLLQAPRTNVGLTPEHLARLEEWAVTRAHRVTGGS
jgi:hypothetical protein